MISNFLFHLAKKIELILKLHLTFPYLIAMLASQQFAVLENKLPKEHLKRCHWPLFVVILYIVIYGNFPIFRITWQNRKPAVSYIKYVSHSKFHVKYPFFYNIVQKIQKRMKQILKKKLKSFIYICINTSKFCIYKFSEFFHVHLKYCQRSEIFIFL